MSCESSIGVRGAKFKAHSTGTSISLLRTNHRSGTPSVESDAAREAAFSIQGGKEVAGVWARPVAMGCSSLGRPAHRLRECPGFAPRFGGPVRLTGQLSSRA
jgi:hypothetical protein